MMGSDEQRAALADLLASYREIDQVTLDETISEIRDFLPDRIDHLKPGESLRRAVHAYHQEAKRIGRDEAKAALWREVSAPEASAALLEALRRKIRQKGYEPVRALFELFQNAVDAARQARKRSDVRVEVRRDDAGRIVNLRLVHWGRPINVDGPDPDEAARENHGRDLANMLVMDHSAKDGPLHGRHGLGFKTVHMLSDNARVACGNLSFEIKGGMLPVPWPEGRALLTTYNRRRERATMIDLPVPVDCSEGAELAWQAFSRAAPLLPAMALDEIGTITLCDGVDTTELAVQVQTLGERVSWLSFAAHAERKALCFDMGEGFALYLPFIGARPVRFGREWHRLWNLVPLDGEAPNCAWMIEGPFVIDQGRRGLSGTSAAKPEQFRRLGHQLGISLVQLYEHWGSFAASAGLPTGEREGFFSALVELFADDLHHDGPQRELHGPGRGLGALLAQCPLVPMVFGANACSGDVRWVLAGALVDQDILDRARVWLDRLELNGCAVDERWAGRLRALSCAEPKPLRLATVAEVLFANPDVTPERARVLGGVFNPREQQAWPRDERDAMNPILRQVQLQAEDGGYRPANRLAFPQDTRQGSEGDTERARAAIAPTSARLCVGYADEAVDFAQLVRSAIGYRHQELHDWLKLAGGDPARMEAALRYLADRPREIDGLKPFTPWLPRGDALLAFRPFRMLDLPQQAILTAALGDLRRPIHPGPMSPYFDARDVLEQIRDWWEDDRDRLIADYEKAVYPERDLFDPRRLAEHRDQDWFTMLGLAVSQTLGRVQPEQSRSFIQQALHEGWWHELAAVGPRDTELRPFVDRLLAWSEPDDREQFMVWRRCLVDLCRIARHLEDYRALFREFPRLVAAAGRRVSLSNTLQPQFSSMAGRIAPDAANISRSLGIGANWMVRELGRCGYYDPAQAAAVLPYGWATAARVRELLKHIGLGEMEHGVDASWYMHRQVADCMGMDNPFGEDGDLPLHVITLATHRDDYNAILGNSAIEGDSINDWPSEFEDA